MASVADIKKRLQKNGISTVERTRDPYKTDSSKESGYVGSDAFQKIKDRVKSSGVSFDIDDDYINTFISDATDFVSTASKDLNGINWSNASSTYTARDEAWVDLSQRADYIRSYLNSKKDKTDNDKEILTYLDSISPKMSNTMEGFRVANRHYSQWETEEDYNKAVEAQKEYEELMNFDLDTAGEEIGILDSELTELRNKRGYIKSQSDAQIRELEARNTELELWVAKGHKPSIEEYQANKAKIEALRKPYTDLLAEIDAKEAVLTQKRQQYTLAERLQNGVALTNDAMNASDFEDKSQYVSTESDKWFARLTSQYGMGYDDLTYEYINGDAEMRASIRQKHSTWSKDNASDVESYYEEKGYDHMTPKEVKIYNYYYATQGKEKAQEYLDYLQESLNYRKATEKFESLEDKPFLEYMFGVEAGLDQFASGIESLFSGEDYIPQSATQIASGMVREDLADVGFNLPEWMGGASIGQVGYDMTTTTANMLPSILVSFVPVVGQVASPVLLGASAAGNAKSEMLRLGYTKEQANTYGILVGASEGTLQYLLGGISKLGGKVSGNVISKVVSQIDNGLAKAAIQLGGSMVSEGVEEALQSILEPYFKSCVTAEDFEGVNWEEVVYSGLLGALSAFGLEGSGTAVNALANKVAYNQQLKQHGQTIIDKGGVDSLKALALDVAGVNQNAQGQKVATLAGKVEQKATAKNVGKLSATLEKTISSQNNADIQNALVKKGMSSKEAMRVAKYLAGEIELSEKQMAEIENNANVKAVVNELLNDPKSSVNERARSLMVARQGNATETASVAPKATKSGDLNVKVEVDVDGRVSESGKTTRISTGEAVTIDKNNAIAKVEEVDGERVVYLNTDQGVVESTDVSYASESEALIYESFVDMTPGMANAVIKHYDGSVPVQTYIDGMREGILLYGMHNFQAVGKDISNASALAELSDIDQDFALKLGRAFAKTDAEAQEASMRKTTENAEKRTSSDPTPKKVKGGKVSFENGVKAKTREQKNAVRLAKYLSSAIGINIVFYDARNTIDKRGEGANGFFDEATNAIHLDIQKSHNDTKTIAFTLSHELVHFIKKWSPAKFNTFASFLMEQYAEHGVDTSTLLANKMADLNTKDADLAYEEMICDACETMLLDSNAMVKLMKLRQTDLDLFEKLKLHIMELLNAIREAYRKLGYEATTDEAKALLKMTDVLEKFHALFEEAAVDATRNFQADKTLTTESVSVSEDGTVRLQMKQYQQTGRATLLNYLRDQYGNENANDLILTIDSIYDTLVEFKNNEALSVFSNWQNTEVELDENGHPIFTTSIKNGDYELNQDFSRVCKKRRQLDFVLNMLAEDPAFEASHLTKSDFVKINNAIKKHGFEIACALCFVDSKRFRQAEWADSFANTWNDILNAVVKDGSKLTPFNFATKNPNTSDEGIEIDTSKAVTYRKWSDGKEDVKNRRTYESFEQMLSKGADGNWLEGNTNVRTIATLIRDNPELRHTFRGADIIASQGFDTIQRLAPGIRSILDGWGGSSVPKPSSNDTSYDNSILNMSGYKKETAYAMGGVRMNSFSDFMAHMFFDYCQAFADLSAKELPSQAYTKELNYVRFFGRSGQKINMSGIAAIRDDALPTTAQKGVTKAQAEANEKIEKMIAGLDVSRLLEHLGKDIYQLTEADVEQFLDMCDYVWADESINMKHATLLQTGILYDRLSESKVEECYELLKAGEIEQALAVAGKDNVDTEYAKHCGTIVVGVSDAHIRKLLRDPTVRMVIPYHKSGLNPVIARELRISAYNDYTLTQTTGVKRKGAKTSDKIGSKAIKDSFGLVDFAFYDWFGKTIDGKLYDGKATADKYLEWCEKGYYDEAVGDYVYYTTKGDGYILAKDFHKKATIIPKFDAFMGEENYYKVLEDFDCYDTITGEHSAQGAVDFLRKGLPSDYKQVLKTALEEEQKTADDFRDHLDNKGLKEEVMNIVKARGYEPSVKKQAKKTISQEFIDKTLDSFGIEKPGDYIHVQRKVLTTLTDEGFFTDPVARRRTDVNEESGMVIETNKSGIDETFNLKNYARLGMQKKIIKLSTIRMLPEIIRTGKLITDNVPNQYRDSTNKNFAYIEYEGEIDGIQIALQLDIKKSPQKNKFWVHRIVAIENVSDFPASTNNGTEAGQATADVGDIIHQEEPIVKGDSQNSGTKFQKKRDSSTYAPTFYSQMSRVVDDIKMDKIGATSLVNYLKGKGIKHDEIKWSGIEAWLEGKKSVTKAELQEFLAGSQLVIEEELGEGGATITLKPSDYGDDSWDVMRGGEILDTYSWSEESELYESDTTGGGFSTKDRILEHFKDKYCSGNTRWEQYKLDGGTNYREFVFKMPNSFYSNQAMRTHWGDDAKGVLAHARIQDMTTNDGKRMLFVEEIQSDWHNEGHYEGYAESLPPQKAKRLAEIESREGMLIAERNNIMREYRSLPSTESEKQRELLGKYDKLTEQIRKLQDDIFALWGKKRTSTLEARPYNPGIPDAPFRDTYHEYVLKRLLRMAAEEGYDSIGWTPSEIQVDRWSDEFAEGYRIEYDQDIPKFLRKYGKKWGATVGKDRVGGFDEKIDVDVSTPIDDDVWLLDEGVSFEGTEVWSMDITESMEQSVLYEGQAKFQKKQLSNRTILANAIESTIDTSTPDGQNALKLLKDYQGKIALIEKEEARLAEVKSEIAEISFTKGTDRSKLDGLNAEKMMTANRIHTYDKQLMRLEAMKPIKDVLAREKEMVRKRTEEKGREAIKAVKEREAKKTRILLNRASESRKKAVEHRKMTDVRNKIKRFKAQMESTLQHPTDNKYIPLNLVQAMVDVCELIDTDTPLYKADGSLNKAQERRNATKERLQLLKDEYENLKTNIDPMYSGEFDDVIYKYLGKLRTDFEGKSLADMTLAELEEMYDILKSINGTIMEARKLIGWGDMSSVYEAGDTIVSEQEAITKSRKNEKRNSAQKAKDWVVDMSLSPVRNIERMSGYRQNSPMLKLFQDFERGVRKKNMFAMESYKAFEALTSGENTNKYEDAIYKEFGSEYTDVNGRKFKVSKMQMMQAILSYEREQANKMHHIEGSGFTFADLNMLRKGKLKEAVSEEYSHRIPFATSMVEKFVEALENDKWAQDYMEAARQFFNGKAKDAINETYITLKHRIIARDQKYIPFEVDKNFVVREISAENDIQQTINSYGMLKDTKVGASQPLIITGLNNILDRHIDQVGNVYGLAVAIRNFNKVWNVRSVASNFGGDPTVQAAIERNWGVGGKKFVTQTVQDLQGARPNAQSELYRKAKSGYIGATFLLNLSVVTKQIGSLYSATSMLKWRDPVRMVGNLVYTMANSKKISAEVDKYTATIWMRRQGLSDAELATLATQAKKPGISKAVSKLPTALNPTKWITGMDAMVALSLWKYAKEDTAKRTGLTGEELMKATAEFYDSLIENTQSMTDVLHRPEIQKRSDVISEAFGMFKTDLYQMAGQLQTTLGRYQNNKTKENKSALGRTVYSVAMSALWGSLMTSLFALLRYKVDPYRDDEDDELTVGSWLKKGVVDLIGDMAGYVIPLFGSEVVGFIDNIMNGKEDDAIDSLALTAINDLYSTIVVVGNSIAEREMPSADEWIKLATKSLQILGVPANNIKRTIDAIRLHAKDIANGEFFSFEAGLDKPNSQRLYNAIISGDKERIEKATRNYKDQKAIDSAIRKALRENDPRIQEAVMAHYEGDIKKRASITLEIESEGNFTSNIVRGTINNAITNLNTNIQNALKAKALGNTAEHDKIVKELLNEYPKDFIEKMLGETILEEESETEGKEIPLFKTEDYYSAILNGDTGAASIIYEELINEKIEEGYIQSEAEDAIATGFANEVKKAYMGGDITSSKAVSLLTDYTEKGESEVKKWDFELEYGLAWSERVRGYRLGKISESELISAVMDIEGEDRTTAEEYIRFLDLEMNNPSLDISAYDAEQYFEYAESAGISIDVFLDYKAQTKGLQSDKDANGNSISGSKKKKVLAVIDSLPITSSQKDALYFAEGWSEKTLNEAPWH